LFIVLQLAELAGQGMADIETLYSPEREERFSCQMKLVFGFWMAIWWNNNERLLRL
jgi:hypothetical protein